MESESVRAPALFRERLQAALGAAYVLERELGGGGMSRVFVAREEALGRDVVVKVLAPELTAGLSAERFAREATGVVEVTGLWPSGVEHLEHDRLAVVFALRRGGGVRVVVGRSSAVGGPLTCSATAGAAVWSHHLESVDDEVDGVVDGVASPTA